MRKLEQRILTNFLQCSSIVLTNSKKMWYSNIVSKSENNFDCKVRHYTKFKGFARSRAAW